MLVLAARAARAQLVAAETPVAISKAIQHFGIRLQNVCPSFDLHADDSIIVFFCPKRMRAHVVEFLADIDWIEPPERPVVKAREPRYVVEDETGFQQDLVDVLEIV